MKKILSFTLSLIVSLTVSVSYAYAVNFDSMAGIVSTEGGRLNVRSSAEGYILTSVPNKSYLSLIEKNGDWWKVEYSDKKFGYCHSDYIEIVSDETAYVSTESGNLNVRSGAGKSYSVIDTVKKGENVIVLSTTGYWSRILYNGNKVGIVSADYLSVNRKGYGEIYLDVPDFKQTDSRWANVKIGSSGKTIGKIGCVTTGISMIESYRTKSTIYPDAMSKMLSYDSKGNVYWPNDYSVNFWSENYLLKIYNALKSEKPVLIGAKNASGSQHWVVVTGFSGGNYLSASSFLINDPGSRTNKNLSQFFADFPTLYKFFIYT